jgi:hypothetical protein
MTIFGIENWGRFNHSKIETISKILNLDFHFRIYKCKFLTNMHKKPVSMALSAEAAAESQNLCYRGPSLGHPWARGRSKLSTVLKVLGAILSTYRVPSKWSHSCCKIRACQPEAVILIGAPLRSKPVTSTSRYRSTTALNPSTLQDFI